VSTFVDGGVSRGQRGGSPTVVNLRFLDRNNGITIVNVPSNYAYRILTNSLKANPIPWFSYENKQNRDIKVMIKNLHHSSQPINILRSLNAQGLQALNATPKLVEN
jgi:hypothetical protein